MLAMSDRILQMYASNSSKLFLGSLVKKGNLVQIVILFGVSFSMIRIPTKSYFKARGGNARERWLGMDCDGDRTPDHVCQVTITPRPAHATSSSNDSMQQVIPAQYSICSSIDPVGPLPG